MADIDIYNELLGISKSGAEPAAEPGLDIYNELLGLKSAAPAAGAAPAAEDPRSFGSRLGHGVLEGAINLIPNLLTQAKDTVKGAYKLGTTPPAELGKGLLEAGKGAASSATLGAYTPEGGDPELQALGRTGVDVATGKFIYGPLLKALGGPVVKTVAGMGLGAGLGGASAAVQGGDVASGMGQGLGASLGVDAAYGTARAAGQIAGHPIRQAVSKKADTEAEFTDRMGKYGRALNDVQHVNERNKATMVEYEKQVAQAQSAVLAGVVGAKENLAAAIDTRNMLQSEFDLSVKGAADQARKLRPALAPAAAYAEFNLIRDTAPQTLPSVDLIHTTKHVNTQAARIINSSENLPREAAMSTVEKLAVGLDSTLTDTSKLSAHPNVIASFGERWKNFDPEMKQLANEKYIAQVGISGDDIASLTSGKLRLDQFDRIRQLVGEKAGAGSGLASSIYHSLMEDLRNSKDPMAKGYIEANRSYGQTIAAMDLTRMVLPAMKDGLETIDAAKLNDVKKMFSTYDKDPQLLKFDERQIVESIPRTERQPFLDYIDTIFVKRKAAKTSERSVREAQKSLSEAEQVKPEKIAKPKLQSNTMPDLSDYGPLTKYPDMNYDLPFGFGTAYSAGRAGGASIAWSILAATGLGYMSSQLFRLGLKPEGRQFAKSLFMDGPPKWGDKARMIAVQSYLQAQDFNEERKRRMQGR